jgi:uncharacterized protein
MTSWRAFARRLAVVVLVLAAPLPVRAQQGDVPIPPYTGYVTDDAGVIGDERQAQLEAFLDQLQKKTGVQFAVLTVASTAPEEPSLYKTRVFKSWGIGNAERDDGLLLLVAMEQHEVRFETGYGLEGTLPDGWQSRMVRDLVLSRFREGQPEEGITAAVLACAQRIGAEKNVALEWNGKELRYDREKSPRWARYLPLLLFFLVFFVILPAIRSSRGRGGRGGWGGWYGGGGFGGGGLGGWGGGFGGGGGGFGGGGGSSFGGFGGGSSGGGGGGGKW